MAIKQDSLRAFVKRKISTAKASKGWTWDDLSALIEELGGNQSATTLTTKHSRGSFRAQDFLLLLRAMGVRFIDLSDLDVAGLDEAVRKVDARKRAR
ncbi:MAG: DUF6471 domain-containing protein [Dokdonella sp.]